MSQTVVALGDPKAQKRWSATLAVDARKKSYFENRFIGTDDNAVIQRKTELETGVGDRTSFPDLCVQMRNRPTYGDQRLEGKEESLSSTPMKSSSIRFAMPHRLVARCRASALPTTCA